MSGLFKPSDKDGQEMKDWVESGGVFGGSTVLTVVLVVLAIAVVGTFIAAVFS